MPKAEKERKHSKSGWDEFEDNSGHLKGFFVDGKLHGPGQELTKSTPDNKDELIMTGIFADGQLVRGTTRLKTPGDNPIVYQYDRDFTNTCLFEMAADFALEIALKSAPK